MPRRMEARSASRSFQAESVFRSSSSSLWEMTVRHRAMNELLNIGRKWVIHDSSLLSPIILTLAIRSFHRNDELFEPPAPARTSRVGGAWGVSWGMFLRESCIVGDGPRASSHPVFAPLGQARMARG